MTFIDRALAGYVAHLQVFYRRGIDLFDQFCIERTGKRFRDLDEAQQDEMLRGIEGSTDVDQPGRLGQFFAVVYEHTLEGTFCDPIHGGNRDAAGWRMLGFPGAHWGYSKEQMAHAYDSRSIPISTLADIEAREADTKAGEWTMDRKIDAVVVGLGAAGGIIASELARAGLYVVALEKGAYYKPGDFKSKFDEIRYYTRAAIVPKMATDPMTWRGGHNEKAEVLPWASNKLGLGDPFQIPPSLGTGGGTINWGADLVPVSRGGFPHEVGDRAAFLYLCLPEGNTLVDWPIGYADLEPYYDRTEWDLGVGGVAGNVGGVINDAGNVFESPRRRGYPMPPLDRSSTDGVFTAAARRMGYHPYPTPTAIATVPYKGRNACTNCGFCHGYPCHVGAKVSTNEIVRTTAEETGNLEIRPFSRVIRVNKGADGGVKGVSYIEFDEHVADVEAPIVILGAYAFENARLLLVSGITGNGHVGRHLSMHNYGWFNGTMPEATNPYMGSLQAGSGGRRPHLRADPGQ